MPPASALQAFDMWLADANIVSRFIAEACEKIPADESVCTTSALYASFAEWCENNGVQLRHRPQQNQFKKRLEDLGIRVSHTDKGSGVFGLKIKSKLGNSDVNGITIPGVIKGGTKATEAVAIPKARVTINPKI